MCRTFRFSVITLLACTGLVRAERVPESKESATHVVAAVVTDRFGKDRSLGYLSETYTDFVVVLKVEAVERGDGLRAGQALYAHCFQRTRNPVLPAPGMAGHDLIPRPGQRIRAYLNRQSDGRFEIVYPAGVELLDGGATGQVVRESAVGPSPWRHVLSFLLGVAVGILVAVLWAAWRSRKKATFTAV